MSTENNRRQNPQGPFPFYLLQKQSKALITETKKTQNKENLLKSEQEFNSTPILRLMAVAKVLVRIRMSLSTDDLTRF